MLGDILFHPRQRQRAGRLRHRPHIFVLSTLESWLREKMKTLSRHSELAKAFTYTLNQWPAWALNGSPLEKATSSRRVNHQVLPS
ncbi:IS66 family transposase, partial [Klebsiella pneumoniae]